ncbi:chemotaxis protein CheB [Fibrella arboris]|uniref:chemotaxis protein CheB n=1 Tax=Fibrella arboris TaxID=3242486 RepID=UPI0035230854
MLPAILSRRSLLEVAHPYDGEPIRPGRIYSAPPDHHLLIEKMRRTDYLTATLMAMFCYGKALKRIGFAR